MSETNAFHTGKDACATCNTGKDACATCWNCGKPSAESLFCKYCNTLQPPTPNYYEFMGLEHKLNLDLQALQKRFYELSRKVHPDRYYSTAGEKERLYSLEASAILNDAYRVLKDPVARASIFSVRLVSILANRSRRTCHRSCWRKFLS